MNNPHPQMSAERRNLTLPPELAVTMPPSLARWEARRYVAAAIRGCQSTRLPSRVFRKLPTRLDRDFFALLYPRLSVFIRGQVHGF
jgi:hypothetical protein